MDRPRLVSENSKQFLWPEFNLAKISEISEISGIWAIKITVGHC